jgi:hypothetical protein
MNPKAAFLVPVHPPHFKFARDLLASFQKCELDSQSDVWFVFTNEEEQDKFGDYQNAVVLPPELRVFDNGGIINIKKFYGLRQIQNKYEYIIVLDAESLFIRNAGVHTVCEEYFTSKILLGSEVLPEGIQRTEGIKNSCRRFFIGQPGFEKLNNPLYLWFNQPCIYKTSTLPDFWEKIDYDNNIKNLVWLDFDYYVYMFYLMLFQEFQIENMEIASNYGICEASLDLVFFKSNKYETLPILMVSQAVLHKFDNPKLFIIIHLDRDRDWMFRVMSHKTDNCLQQVSNMQEQISEIQNQFNYHIQQMNEMQNRIGYMIQQIHETKEQAANYTNQQIQEAREQAANYINYQVQEIKRWQERWTMKNILRRLAARFIPIRKLRDKIRGQL